MYLDLFLVLVLVWAVVSGWRAGFVKEAFSTLGVIVGLVVALVVYALLGNYLRIEGTDTNMVLSIIAFLLLCIVVPIVCGFVANILTAAVRTMRLGLPNSVLGSAMSVVKFVLLLSFAFNTMEGLHIMSAERVAGSRLYEPLCGVLPFFEEEGRNLLRPAATDAEPNDTTIIIHFDRDREPAAQH